MGRGIGYVGSLAMHPPFSFRLAEKENGPHPQGVCRIRKRHSRQRLRNGRSKRKDALRKLARMCKFA